MRIWNINPKMLCGKHLLGERVETHMFFGCIRKCRSLNGYLEKGLVELHNLKKRHDTLAKEIKRRSFRHGSVLPRFKVKVLVNGRVDSKANKNELASLHPMQKTFILGIDIIIKNKISSQNGSKGLV